MAYFAQLDENNIVINVLSVENYILEDENGIEQEKKGIDFLLEIISNARFVQTSYNARIRKHYAGIGYVYDSERDAFIQPCPYDSWVLDEETCTWVCPIPRPINGLWKWDEDLKNWIEIVDGQENQ